MNISLQVNNSEKNALSKSISTTATLSGTLKNETNIVDPTILVEGDISSYARCNYMSIPAFGRSYFITDMRSIRNNLFEVKGHCDVLSSFASQIRSNTCIIRKQETDWNLYLNDGTFRTYQDPLVLTKEFPGGFNGWEFVLAVAGS